MALTKAYIKVEYSGPNVGPIYLADIGVRYSLQGGLYNKIGQDQVINKGDIIYLVQTGEVMLSIEKGALKTHSTDGYFTKEKDARFIQGLLFSGKITNADLDSNGSLKPSLVLSSVATIGNDGVRSGTAMKGHGAIPKNIGEF